MDFIFLSSSTQPGFVWVLNTNSFPHNVENSAYIGGVPGTSLRERIDWFQNGVTYEHPHQRSLNIRNEPPPLFLYRLNLDLEEKKKTMERLIIARCLPAPYRKDVGKGYPMYLTEMDKTLWDYFLSKQDDKPVLDKLRSQSYPDRGYKRKEQLHYVEWKNGVHPTLSTPQWFLIKWSEEGRVYRAYVSSILFVRNGWTGMVRVEFTYWTWVFDPLSQLWEHC
jgi:hypothetical protein